MELFAERLERLIKEKGLTQVAVADSVGIRRPTISDWKKNGSYPTADVAVKIARLLDVSVEYLVTGEDTDTARAELAKLKRTIKDFAEKL